MLLLLIWNSLCLSRPFKNFYSYFFIFIVMDCVVWRSAYFGLRWLSSTRKQLVPYEAFGILLVLEVPIEKKNKESLPWKPMGFKRNFYMSQQLLLWFQSFAVIDNSGNLWVSIWYIKITPAHRTFWIETGK